VGVFHGTTANGQSQARAPPFLLRGEEGIKDLFQVLSRDAHAACGVALETGQRVIIEGVTTSLVFVGTPALEVQQAASVRAVQSTPLISRSGPLVGVLSTHYRKPSRPADRDLSVLDLLARQAADWMERTQAEEEVRDQEARHRTILDTAVDAVITIDERGLIESVNPRRSGCSATPPRRCSGATSRC
jgi:GAF domain-containing protein